MEERDGDDALQATYVNGAGLDEYILMNRNSTDYGYMESPIIGNVAALLDSSGAVREGYTYRGYGQATVHTGAGNDGVWFTSDDATAAASALGNPYLFTGRDWDSTISLQYNRARWYAPPPGRWLSRDPRGYTDGFDLYEYARGEPVKFYDAWGLSWKSLCTWNECCWYTGRARVPKPKRTEIPLPDKADVIAAGLSMFTHLFGYYATTYKCECEVFCQDYDFTIYPWGWQPREVWTECPEVATDIVYETYAGYLRDRKVGHGGMGKVLYGGLETAARGGEERCPKGIDGAMDKETRNMGGGRAGELVGNTLDPPKSKEEFEAWRTQLIDQWGPNCRAFCLSKAGQKW